MRVYFLYVHIKCIIFWAHTLWAVGTGEMIDGKFFLNNLVDIQRNQTKRIFYVYDFFSDS